MKYLSFIIFVIIALIGTILSFIPKEKNKNRKNFWTFLQILTIYLMFLSIGRLIRLSGDSLGDYSQDQFLILWDLLAGFICYFSLRDSAGFTVYEKQMGIITVFAGVTMLSGQYYMNRNIKNAVYECLLPKNIVLVLIIPFVAWQIYLLRNSRKQCVKTRKQTIAEILIIINFIYTVLFYPFLETVLANRGEFSFSVKAIIPAVVLIILLTYTILSSIRSKIVVFLCATFAICAYMQEMFLNSKLFLMDGNQGRWSMQLKLVNLLIWLVLIILSIAFYHNQKEKWLSVFRFLSIALIIMQGAGAVSLFISGDRTTSGENTESDYFSNTGLYEAASEDNIFVFVLDTYDVDYLNRVVEQKPDFLKPLNGFIYFPDTVSQFSRTFPSIPYMLTNSLYFYEKPYEEYCEDAYAKCDFWEQLNQKGYYLYFYEENREFIGSDIRSISSNHVETGHITEEKISVTGILESMIRVDAFRILPYAWKDAYQYTAEKVNQLIVKKRVMDYPKYTADDAEVFSGVKNNGLTINQDKKAFRFYHLTGAHAPYTLNSQGERVKEEYNSDIEQYMGCMNLVYQYISEMKRLNIFDKSTIIIMADHGENYVTSELDQATNMILFIKPANTDDSVAMTISSVEASQNDIISTIADEQHITCNQFSGFDLLNAQDMNQNRIRYHYYAVVEDTEQVGTRTYKITGNSLNFDNWEKTSEYHKFMYYK